VHPTQASPEALEGQAGTSARRAEGGEDYRQRYKVERSFAWLGNFRRLLIWWEYLVSVYHSFFAIGVLLLCLHRL